MSLDSNLADIPAHERLISAITNEDADIPVAARPEKDAEPEPALKPADPAPEVEEPPATAGGSTTDEFAKLRELLKENADDLSERVESLRPKPEPAKAAANPLLDLLKHEDPEIRALAENNLALTEQVARLAEHARQQDESAHEDALVAAEGEFLKEYRFTEDEMQSLVYAGWNKLAEKDSRADFLTLPEAATRVLGRSLLESRRITPASAPATRPTAPGAPPPARVVAEPAQGGGRLARPAPLDRHADFEEAERRALADLQGMRR